MDIREIRLESEKQMAHVARIFDLVLEDHILQEQGRMNYIEETIKEFNLRMKELRKNLTDMSSHVREINRSI